MIVVIADDITGAAEIAGICLRYNLKVVFAIDQFPEKRADVLILACDSRSEKESRAVEIHTRLAEELKKISFGWLFKKCDSVLRGYVSTETEVLTNICRLKAPLIVPVNPATGRIIRKGEYYINDIPLHKTAFFNDPDFPAHTGEVKKIMAERNTASTSFDIPDCENEQAIIKLANSNQHDLFFTGSSAWFHEILLLKMHLQRSTGTISTRTIENFIVFNGSLHPSGQDFLKTSDKKFPVEIIPPEFYQGEIQTTAIAAFQEKLKHAFEQSRGLFIFQHPDVLQYCSDTSLLINRTMQILENILLLPQSEQLLITGGATAYAVFNHLKIQVLIPEEELAPGVLNFRIPGEKIKRIAVKPGSYPWGIKFI